jgi:nudix motif 8
MPNPPLISLSFPLPPSFTLQTQVLKSVLIGNKANVEFTNLGIIRSDKKEDLRLLITNYTAPALAGALRDREDTLQLAADLLRRNEMTQLEDLLSPHEAQYIELRRRRKVNMDLGDGGFSYKSIEMLRKYLSRMPRQVTKAHRHRAAVVLPLCNLNGVPSVLFEKRAYHLRKHPGEVCFPGGMLSEGDDSTIVNTSLREMAEELGLSEDAVSVRSGVGWGRGEGCQGGGFY